MIVFSSGTRLRRKYLPKITVSGLNFTQNRPEAHFICGFIEMWMSVEIAGGAKIRG